MSESRSYRYYEFVMAAFYAAVGRMIDALGVQLEPAMRDHSPRLSTK